MARYKDYNLDQDKFIPINFSKQITKGSFEHTVSVLVDEFLDMEVFDERYKNDDGGRPAYDPAIMLKIILSAYARGHVSSRQIGQLCRENVVFMALSADTQPHFTTISGFISQMSDVIQPLFTQVLMTCDKEGLIGREMFAIDGCKLPSNASKEWSGTQAEFDKKRRKMDRAVRRLLAKHREEDAFGQVNDHTRRAAEEKQIETLRKASRKIKNHWATNDDRRGPSGKVVKSNITDPDSAKMKTSHGVLQGYNGVAAADSKHQVITGAEAFGQGPENDLLIPMIEHVKANLGLDELGEYKVTADSGFNSRANLQHCQDEVIDIFLADGNYRKRNPLFADRDRYQPKERQRKHFAADQFSYDEKKDECRCPAGKIMWGSKTRERNGGTFRIFTGYLKDCRSCPLQEQCMQYPVKDVGRQVSIRVGDASYADNNVLEQMKRKIDSDQGRHIYSQRLGTVEPVFGNITSNKKLNRFTLRGKEKVNAQWLMYCMVHNIGKLMRYGNVVT